MVKFSRLMKKKYKETNKKSIVIYLILRLLVILSMIFQIILGNISNVLMCILALILFLFDIAYRRLNLDFSKFIKNKDNKNKKKKLKKKDSISEELAMEKEVKVENKYEKVADLKEVANESKKEKNTRSKKEKKQEKLKVQGIDTNALLKKKNDRNGI